MLKIQIIDHPQIGIRDPRTPQYPLDGDSPESLIPLIGNKKIAEVNLGLKVTLTCSSFKASDFKSSFYYIS